MEPLIIVYGVRGNLGKSKQIAGVRISASELPFAADNLDFIPLGSRRVPPCGKCVRSRDDAKEEPGVSRY